jgi:hypothetical protein
MDGAGFTCGWLIAYRSSQLGKCWPGITFLIVFGGSLASEAYLLSGWNALIHTLASLIAGGATEIIVRNAIRKCSADFTGKEGKI